jgi:hypothetical protein
MDFTAPLPEDMARAVERLREDSAAAGDAG